MDRREQMQRDGVLSFEVPIKCAFGKARARGDFTGRRAVDALSDEEIERRIFSIGRKSYLNKCLNEIHKDTGKVAEAFVA
ncbi:MAG: hypothetical protein AAGJ87_12275, partial [Pseudomonadota bacterium]